MSTTLPPAVIAHAIAVARQVKLNAEHLYCDPGNCEHAGRLFNRCKHGTNIGDPYGADLMCWWCEDGATAYAFGLHSAWAKQRTVVSAITTDLLAEARRADADGRPRVITAQDVYGRAFEGPAERQAWEWLTPDDIVTVSVLIAALAQPKPAHAT